MTRHGNEISLYSITDRYVYYCSSDRLWTYYGGTGSSRWTKSNCYDSNVELQGAACSDCSYSDWRLDKYLYVGGDYND